MLLALAGGLTRLLRRASAPARHAPGIFEAAAADFIRVTNRVHRSPENPSGIRVGVLPQ